MQLCQIGGMSVCRAMMLELTRWSTVKVSGWASREDGHVRQYPPELIPRSGEAGHRAWGPGRDRRSGRVNTALQELDRLVQGQSPPEWGGGRPERFVGTAIVGFAAAIAGGMEPAGGGGLDGERGGLPKGGPSNRIEHRARNARQWCDDAEIAFPDP